MPVAAGAAEQADAEDAQFNEEDSAEGADLGTDTDAAEGLSEDEENASDMEGGRTEELDDDMGLFGEHAVARQRGVRWALQLAPGLRGCHLWWVHGAAAHVMLQPRISDGKTS